MATVGTLLSNWLQQAQTLLQSNWLQRRLQQAQTLLQLQDVEEANPPPPGSGKRALPVGWKAAAAKNWMKLIFLVLGLSCAVYSVKFFVGKEAPFAYGMSILAGIIFFALAFGGLAARDTFLLRRRPHKVVECLFIWIAGVLSFWAGVTFDTSPDYIVGYTFVSVSVFSLFMLAQPSFDYGVLGAFTCLPSQICFLYYINKDTRKMLLYTSLLGVLATFFLLSPSFTVEYFDIKYANKLIDEAAVQSGISTELAPQGAQGAGLADDETPLVPREQQQRFTI